MWIKFTCETLKDVCNQIEQFAKILQILIFYFENKNFKMFFHQSIILNCSIILV